MGVLHGQTLGGGGGIDLRLSWDEVSPYGSLACPLRLDALMMNESGLARLHEMVAIKMERGECSRVSCLRAMMVKSGAG